MFERNYVDIFFPSLFAGKAGETGNVIVEER
jgi:hypothetical protein